jgi:hypothetical protein
MRCGEPEVIAALFPRRRPYRGGGVVTRQASLEETRGGLGNSLNTRGFAAIWWERRDAWPLREAKGRDHGRQGKPRRRRSGGEEDGSRRGHVLVISSLFHFCPLRK